MAMQTVAPPNEIIWTLQNGMIASRCLQLVADLGVADCIDGTAVSAAELADSCEVDAGALDRVLRLLTTYGVFEATPSGYRHTDASRLLRADHPMSMRGFAQLNGLPGVWGALGAMHHSLKTGRPGWEVVDPRGFFPYLAAHPDEAEVFARAMASKAAVDIATIVDAYDFRPFATVADIGGGRGHLLQAILGAAPDSRGILFDVADVTSTLEIETDRLRVQPGDFFTDALPKADLYTLMEVIHDWPDAQAIDILRAIRAAAQPGATVIVIEDIHPDAGIEQRSQILDVVMLGVTGGRERSAHEHARLLEQAGFRFTRVVETKGAMRIVEAVAV
jgi:hypothetical protein